MSTVSISNDASITEIKRTAIDSSGRLGWLYDACRERLVGQLSVGDQEELYQSHKTVQGEIKYGNDDKPQNLLRQLAVDEQLRLSILLNLTPRGSKTSLIDDPHFPNEYTRLFCYSSVNRIQRLPDYIENTEQLISSLISSSTATHIITGVEWGIDLVVVLQLPTNMNIIKEIDHVLDKLLSLLLHDDMDYTFTPDEENLLEGIVSTKVYSNIPDLNKFVTVRDICLCIKEKPHTIIDCPISYTLRPIKWLYPQYDGDEAKFIPLSVDLNDQIEDYVLQLLADMKSIETSIKKDASQLIDEDLKQRFFDVQGKLTNEINQFASKVIEIRRGRIENLELQRLLYTSEQLMIRNSIHDLTQTLNALEEKEQFQYSNVDTNDTNHVENSISTEHQSVVDVQCEQMPDSNDILQKNNSGYLKRLRSDSEEEEPTNNSIDASNTTTPPIGIDISRVSPPPPPLEPPDECETINILLLGETGVGKSTFINAFANYLRFDTLQQAQTGHPIVLIPVSFLITIGDNFDEDLVKFGDVDDSNNEDFEHPGQSVTQHCKSYEFNLNRDHRKKLCIIDTPGFGDTRGIDQDDYNMAHILDYIKNLSHLDAICFLLKPNESRLNIFYRSCLMQLSSFRQLNCCENILFCFTNARSTFYTPGNTAPLLKQMLTSFPMNSVQFKKENTFCFDSESFRYLVALQNSILFSVLERQEYEMSWIKSTVESNRLVNYICKLFISNRTQDE